MYFFPTHGCSKAAMEGESGSVATAIRVHRRAVRRRRWRMDCRDGKRGAERRATSHQRALGDGADFGATGGRQLSARRVDRNETSVCRMGDNSSWRKTRRGGPRLARPPCTSVSRRVHRMAQNAAAKQAGPSHGRPTDQRSAPIDGRPLVFNGRVRAAFERLTVDSCSQTEGRGGDGEGVPGFRHVRKGGPSRPALRAVIPSAMRSSTSADKDMIAHRMAPHAQLEVRWNPPARPRAEIVLGPYAYSSGAGPVRLHRAVRRCRRPFAPASASVSSGPSLNHLVGVSRAAGKPSPLRHFPRACFHWGFLVTLESTRQTRGWNE